MKWFFVSTKKFCGITFKVLGNKIVPPPLIQPFPSQNYHGNRNVNKGHYEIYEVWATSFCHWFGTKGTWYVKSEVNYRFSFKYCLSFWGEEYFVCIYERVEGILSIEHWKGFMTMGKYSRWRFTSTNHTHCITQLAFFYSISTDKLTLFVFAVSKTISCAILNAKNRWKLNQVYLIQTENIVLCIILGELDFFAILSS